MTYPCSKLHCIHLHSPYQMVLSERYSSLSLYNGWDHADYSALANIPVCSIHDYHTLNSLLSLAATQMDGSQNANILAVVRSVSYSTSMWPMYVSFMHEYSCCTCVLTTALLWGCVRSEPKSRLPARLANSCRGVKSD